MQQEQRHQQQAVKASILTKRRAAARARQYYNEYELRLKAKLQKRRTREEQVCPHPSFPPSLLPSFPPSFPPSIPLSLLPKQSTLARSNYETLRVVFVVIFPSDFPSSVWGWSWHPTRADQGAAALCKGEATEAGQAASWAAGVNGKLVSFE